MHTHAAGQDAISVTLPLYLSYGIVGVRDMGAKLEQLQQARAALGSDAPLPDMVAAGPLLDGPKMFPYVPDVAVILPDVEGPRARP
jgi:hypothetical protein